MSDIENGMIAGYHTDKVYPRPEPSRCANKECGETNPEYEFGDNNYCYHCWKSEMVKSATEKESAKFALSNKERLTKDIETAVKGGIYAHRVNWENLVINGFLQSLSPLETGRYFWGFISEIEESEFAEWLKKWRDSNETI